MASKRRLRRECRGKRAYAVLDEAMDAVREHRARGIGDVHAYRCPLCRRWHLGHRPAAVNRAIEARLGVPP